MPSSNYVIRRAKDTPRVDCPCGQARRIITGEHNDNVSIHRVSISKEAKTHYHKRMTEYYVILSGSGEMELDGERVPVSEGDVIMIPPLTKHAARGDFEIINIVCPPFDPADEFVVEATEGE